MTTGLRNGLGAATFTLALGLAVAPTARADSVVDGRLVPKVQPATPGQRANAYLAKGQLSLAMGQAGAAAADLEQAVRLKPADAYNVLWLHLARNKEHAPDAVELQMNADRANHATWPAPLLDYLTGKIDASAVLARADMGPTKTRQMCEANLFLGQEDLAKGRRSQGLERLQAAARACDAETGEARLALADLGPDAPKPVLTQASNPAPKPAPLPASPTLKPAAVRSSAQTQSQTQILAGDPLLLRGSLK
jgi:lipoprotein NlpI